MSKDEEIAGLKAELHDANIFRELNRKFAERYWRELCDTQLRLIDRAHEIDRLNTVIAVGSK